MRITLFVILALLIALFIVFQQSLGMTPAQLFDAVLHWPLMQQLAALAIVAIVLLLLGIGIWQADRIAQQTRALDTLQRRMSGLRDEVSATGEEQSVADAAVGHLVGTDPVAAIDDIQRRLAGAEARTSVQEGQNDAVDLQTRIDEVRRRQQTLRTQLGSVSEKRRAIEPLLVEMKERQGLIERSLADLEKDETGKGLHARLEDAEAFLNRGHSRLDALQAAFEGLGQIRERSDRLHAEIAPLKQTETGIKALLGGIVALQGQIDTALLSLEKDENETIDERVARLSRSKAEIEQRIAALTDCFGSLETMRKDIGDHFERLSAALNGHLGR